MGSAAEHRRRARRAGGEGGASGHAGEAGAQAPTEIQQRRRLAAAGALGTLQAGGSAISPAEGRSGRRSRRRGPRRPGPGGERIGQRRIASAHCCPARPGAAPSRGRSERPLRVSDTWIRPRGAAAPRVSAQGEGTRAAGRVWSAADWVTLPSPQTWTSRPLRSAAGEG